MTLTEHLAELRTRIIRSPARRRPRHHRHARRVRPGARVPAQAVPSACATSGPNFCDCGLQFISPLEGFTHPPVDLDLRRHHPGAARADVAALAVHRARPCTPRRRSTRSRSSARRSRLFALGGFLAYWTLEKALEFLIAWAGEDVQANFRVSEYVRLVGLMVAAFGIAFEFPVLLVVPAAGRHRSRRRRC